MVIRLVSNAFEPGHTIPTRHTCDGNDMSPPLRWEHVPSNAISLALLCDDPDAPAGTWTHWLLYDIPPEIETLAEGIAPDGMLPFGARQGTNSFGRLGYGGPCPPRGNSHRYTFTLYALDTRLELPHGATKQTLQAAMEGHIIAEGQLIGVYQRR